ncbi:MAG: hypothetical protein WBC28_13365, partial [Candidatus Microthrix parvicella]
RAETSRREEWQLTFLHSKPCELERFGDVPGLKIRMLSEDLFVGHAIGNHRDDSRYGKTQTSNARDASHRGWV